MIRDHFEYVLPFGPLGKLAQALFVRRTLNEIFDFRREAATRYFGPVASDYFGCRRVSGKGNKP